MPKFLMKLGDDQYVEWSTVVDDATTFPMSREEIAGWLTEEYGRSSVNQEWIATHLARCDETGHSARYGRMKNVTPLEIINGSTPLTDGRDSEWTMDGFLERMRKMEEEAG